MGGKLPAEHGHGTEYAAPRETRERWMKADPSNTMCLDGPFCDKMLRNPGALTSELRDIKYCTT